MAHDKIKGKDLKYDSGSDTLRKVFYYLKYEASDTEVKSLYEKARKSSEHKVKSEDTAQRKFQIRYNGSDYDDYTLEKAA